MGARAMGTAGITDALATRMAAITDVPAGAVARGAPMAAAVRIAQDARIRIAPAALVVGQVAGLMDRARIGRIARAAPEE